MKDITAFLIDYANPADLNRALHSLNVIRSRLKSVIIVQHRLHSFSEMHNYEWMHQMACITAENNLGETLNNKIQSVNSEYLLFLHDTDYLSSAIETDSLYLSPPKEVLVTFCQTKQIVTRKPLFVNTSLLQKHKLLLDDQLPFKEALFPAWLSMVDDSSKTFNERLVKQARSNSSTNTIRKQEMIQKFDLKKFNTDGPSLSVIIANYNMEKYVEAAVASCLLQNEQPEQILIIDDGSTDNSYQQLLQWHDGEQVQVFKQQNEGKARALNNVLPYVTSDFILELDADDWLDPDTVSVVKQQLNYLPEDVSVLYGNFRKWKQLEKDVLYKGVAKGKKVNGKARLLSYRFPLGPRIYRTSSLKAIGGFPVIAFEDGRLYEDVSVLHRLINHSKFKYHDFTVYNVREHKESITKNNHSSWKDFLKALE